MNNSNQKAQVESFDFGTVEAPVSANYLKPGQYKLGIVDAKFVVPDGVKQDGSKKASYIEVTFEGELGKVNEKFYVSPGALPRLQYLHEQWFGKKCDKPFKSAEEVGRYFEKVMPMKKDIKKGIIVHGTQSQKGAVYANLKPFDFVIAENVPYEEGAYDENSMQYKAAVKWQPANPSTNTNDMILPESVPAHIADNGTDFDDMPF